MKVIIEVEMGRLHQAFGLLCRQLGVSAAAVCVAGLAGPARAGTAPKVEPRVMTQLGLETPLALNLLVSEIAVINNYNVSPPACTKLASAGSVKTLSVKKNSTYSYTSKIDTYFDGACKKPYFEAEVTTTIDVQAQKFVFSETATYFLANGKELGKLASSNIFLVTGKIETIGGLAKFKPVGGQPVAEVGFVCSIPASGKVLTIDCQSGVAQTFKSLDLSIASVVPFSLTAFTNTDAPKVSFKATASDVRTGPAGSLSITVPKSGELAIGGGGTVYTSTALSGTEAKFSLFPPAPTSLGVTDTKADVKFSYRVLTSASRGAVSTVEALSPKERLASLTTDETGTGKVKYSDGSSAAIRGFLAGD